MLTARLYHKIAKYLRHRAAYGALLNGASAFAVGRGSEGRQPRIPCSLRWLDFLYHNIANT